MNNKYDYCTERPKEGPFILDNRLVIKEINFLSNPAVELSSKTEHVTA